MEATIRGFKILGSGWSVWNGGMDLLGSPYIVPNAIVIAISIAALPINLLTGKVFVKSNPSILTTQ